jgi:uncharacterized membrane protein
METSPPADPEEPGKSHAIAQLAARVAALELEVAALSGLVYQDSKAVPAPSTPFAEPIHHAPPPIEPVKPFPARRDNPPPPANYQQPPPAKSLEDRLGSQVFNLIGIVALIVGAAWALRLAIEEGWIGPAGRVIIGLAAGSGLILWSELFRRKGLAAFSYSLKAVGTGVLYLSLWAGFQRYHLLPASVALALMILVTAWNAFIAFTQDAELLAAYALIGGLLTPLLLSTGGDHETFLFTYVAAIDLGIVALLRWKPWPRLLLPAYAATIAYFIGYYSSYFHTRILEHFRPGPLPPRQNIWDAQSSETALFAIVFSALFALVSTKSWESEEVTTTPDIIVPVLIPLTNAAFVSLALYSVLQDSGLHSALAWLMVALAAIFLGLMRVQKTSLAAAMHLAAAIVFLTVAIPLKAQGPTLTTAWLAEGLILFWASTRFSTVNPTTDLGAPGLASETWEGTASTRVLWFLSGAGYVLGLSSVLFHWTWNYGVLDRLAFFNANLGSALIAILVLAGAAWLSRPNTPAANPAILIAALSAIDCVALLLTLRAFTANVQDVIVHVYVTPPTAFANPNFATALIGLALLAATTWTSWTSFKADPDRFALLRPTAACDLILFNLTALFLIENEIGALFTNSEAELQRSLAISAFLMVYGAILLAAGFWRRNAFVRWQALILILFTIAKVFLYDISGLSAGYRVASFLALGALLLTVSYAYQKDWLALKNPPSANEDRA